MFHWVLKIDRIAADSTNGMDARTSKSRIRAAVYNEIPAVARLISYLAFQYSNFPYDVMLICGGRRLMLVCSAWLWSMMLFMRD